MSILDKASFVLAPGGYSEGYVYGLDSPIAPKKLAYSRAATSTRVNPKGLIESAPYNRLLNSENLLNTATWTTSAFITKTAGFLDPFGGNNACKIDLGAGNNYIVQNTNQKLGTVTISGYFRADSDTFLSFNDGAANPNRIDITTTWKRFQFTFTTGAGFDSSLQIDNYYGLNPAGQTKSFYVFGLQLVQGTEAKDYLPTTDGLNVPTLDYSTGKPTYLFEPSITNYALPFSGDVYNATTAPDGNNTATKITYPAGSSYGSYFTFQSFSFTGVRTLSIYAKSAGYNLMLDAGSYSANNFVIFDLTNGVVSHNPSGLPTTMTNVGNGWYRCTMTSQGTALNEVGAYTFLISIINGTTTSNYQSNNGTSGIFVWGAQLQTGPSATSYIPTTNASVTRVGGVTGGFGASYFGTNKGTVLMGVEGIKSLVTGGSSATIRLQAGGNLVMTLYDDSSGVGFYDYYGNNFLCLVNRNSKKMLIKWDGTTSVGFVDGVKTATLTTGSTRNIDNMGGLGAYMNAYNLSVFAIFPEALSDAECIALTS